MKNYSDSETIINYYAFQSKIYDLTRWTFLFGRKSLLKLLLPHLDESKKLIELGCGTGYNLQWLERKSKANLCGLDISEEMLRKADRKLSEIKLINREYDSNSFDDEEYDIILMSYFVTLNRNYQQILENAKGHLKHGGLIAIVDFYDTNSKSYDKFMKKNHIFIDSKVFDYAKGLFLDKYFKQQTSIFQLWDWAIYIGEKA